MSEVTPRPFEIHVPDRQLDDLRWRIELTRWPDEQADMAWTQGLPLATARELAQAWVGEFDWRAREARLNRYDQVSTVADGAQVFPNGLAGDPDPPLRRAGQPRRALDRVRPRRSLPAARGAAAAAGRHRRHVRLKLGP